MMSSLHAHRHRRSSHPCLLLLVGLTASQTIPTKTYEVHQRAFTDQPSSLVRDYLEEYAYIQEPREAATNGQANGASDRPPAATAVPGNLTGLAFSGGGIRSATFHMGILQALHDMQCLPKIDYLGTFSGGSYIAGWMFAHLGIEEDDVYGNLVQTMDQGKLLDPQRFCHAPAPHAGFIKEGGFLEGPKLMWGCYA